jgi:hypothetical protein
MYRAFRLAGGVWAQPYQEKTSLVEGWMKIGREMQVAQSNEARASLQSCLGDKIISGTKLSQQWFPQIKADVFISHSHKDEEEAIKLAGMLKSFFGLYSFVDSCVWGHAEDLLRLLDDEYCKSEGGLTYDYIKRNGSTSHVHMMLSTALSTMLDVVECVLFLNTPDSINSVESIYKTESPWIFFELSMLRVLRRREPARSIRESFGSKRAMLRVAYDLTLDDLTPINGNQFRKWMAAQLDGDFSSEHSLDLLYYVTSSA